MNRKRWFAVALVVALGCQERIDPLGPRELAESAGKGGGKGGSTSGVTMTVLIPSGTAQYIDVFGWNDARQAAGRVFDEPGYGFLWSDGAIQSLGRNSWAFDVDALGHIVGHTWPADGERDRATVWLPSGSKEFLPTPNGKWSHASAISDSGEWVAGDVNWLPAVWRRGTSGGLPVIESEDGQARDVNDSGLVVGTLYASGKSQAVAWRSDGSRESLVPLGANLSTTAEGVNNYGDIVGSARDVDGSNRAVVWRWTGSSWTPPEVLSDPKRTSRRGPDSVATDINDLGKIVLNQSGSAFVWDPDTRTQIPLGRGIAVAINGNDQILGESGGAVVMWTLP